MFSQTFWFAVRVLFMHNGNLTCPKSFEAVVSLVSCVYGNPWSMRAINAYLVSMSIGLFVYFFY